MSKMQTLQITPLRSHFDTYELLFAYWVTSLIIGAFGAVGRDRHRLWSLLGCHGESIWWVWCMRSGVLLSLIGSINTKSAFSTVSVQRWLLWLNQVLVKKRRRHIWLECVAFFCPSQDSLLSSLGCCARVLCSVTCFIELLNLHS